MLHRIYTEDKNREQVYAILDAHVKGYTVTNATGSWEETRENSIVIDLVDVPAATVKSIAREIKSQNEQQAVLIVAAANSFLI